jgi:restriction endonuclease S subunit
MKRSHLKKDDILMSIVGAIIGNIALVRTDTKQTCSCKLAIFRPRKGVDSITAAVYLKTRYAQNQIQKFRRGAAQTGFLLEDTDQIIMPELSNDFCKIIENTISKMNNTLQKATTAYTTAKNTLLSALGMTNFTPSTEPVAVKSFSESFGVSGRLDAEYYQRKYEETENTLNTTNTVNSLCKVHESTFTPHNNDYKYIELADIGSTGNITGCTIAPFNELPSRARRLVKRGQVIVSSVEGSLSSCALVTSEYDGAICSTGFYVVDSNMINPETLLILFKLAPIQALLKQRCSGTILTAISKTALEEMPFPEIDSGVQQQIAVDVQSSFELRRQSEQLLEAAKRAVEIAIEDSEDAAMAWLAKQVEEVRLCQQ